MTAILNGIAPERLSAIRAMDPDAVGRVLAAHKRRLVLRGDEKLFILAADRPARGALSVGSEPHALANRYELLERLAIALSRPGADGVLSTPGIIDCLALMGLLEGKISCRPYEPRGLHSASFEMDDRFTAYDVPTMIDSRIDFAKILTRVNLGDPGTAATLQSTAQVVTAAAKARLPIMLESFMSTWRDNKLVDDLTPDAVIQSMGIAAGLGALGGYTWLKLPVVAEMERVMQATTLPTLLLGGDGGGDQEARYAKWESALKLPGVRGAHCRPLTAVPAGYRRGRGCRHRSRPRALRELTTP